MFSVRISGLILVVLALAVVMRCDDDDFIGGYMDTEVYLEDGRASCPNVPTSKSGIARKLREALSTQPHTGGARQRGIGCNSVEDNNVLGNRNCPRRLREASGRTIDEAYNWHYAMIADADRNDFFNKSLAKAVEGKKVLVVGSGSGLLDMLAARRGAAHVDGLESNPEMFDVARRNVKANKMQKKVKIHMAASTEFNYRADEEKADVLVAELFGVTLAGEGQILYVADARQRLLKPGGKVIPSAGVQYVTLMQTPSLWHSKAAAKSYDGLRLDAMNAFSQTMGSLRTHVPTDSIAMTERIEVYRVDFTKDYPWDVSYFGNCSSQRATKRIKAIKTGAVHAIVASWEAFGDSEESISVDTHPGREWGPRQQQWGQQVRFLAEEKGLLAKDLPKPFMVKAGEELLLECQTRVSCQVYRAAEQY